MALLLEGHRTIIISEMDDAVLVSLPPSTSPVAVSVQRVVLLQMVMGPEVRLQLQQPVDIPVRPTIQDLGGATPVG
ncbi:hypothetical protein AC578_5020 [Pseudocercospora eumusae]|uniref:Uncharacterized protein n=1 Tax=Pseudocercospora eumusae TaxID=321146 RepID=A0A139H691_9PEZI|nr:hypothetical protein AC578_5020 [Pseudocercospora eumusae]KXS97886.1 hypothetical protein AC578_5020 [Pseudocercospora eumusae]KXS97889.1 hypothetical protein AC578_5020 [Pseudocercospora eumusae]